MDSTQDISKIIGIIMENPDIIEKIKALADKSDSQTNEKSEPLPPGEQKPKAEAVSASADTEHRGAVKQRRHELLSALKPYVKSERARAIDTMLSVIDVIDVMKVR